MNRNASFNTKSIIIITKISNVVYNVIYFIYTDSFETLLFLFVEIRNLYLNAVKGLKIKLNLFPGKLLHNLALRKLNSAHSFKYSAGGHLPA